MLVGLALSVSGVAVMWGTGPALLSAGLGVIAITAYGARR